MAISYPWSACAEFWRTPTNGMWKKLNIEHCVILANVVLAHLPAPTFKVWRSIQIITKSLEGSSDFSIWWPDALASVCPCLGQPDTSPSNYTSPEMNHGSQPVLPNQHQQSTDLILFQEMRRALLPGEILHGMLFRPDSVSIKSMSVNQISS